MTTGVNNTCIGSHAGAALTTKVYSKPAAGLGRVD